MIQFQPTYDAQYRVHKYLITKELMLHKDCYLEYVRCLREDTSNIQANDIDTPQLGDFLE